MTQEAREARNRYQREYRAKHPEQVKQWQKNFWERRAKREQSELGRSQDAKP